MRRIGVAMLVALGWGLAVARAEPTRVGEEIQRRYGSPHPYAAARPGADDLVWSETITFAGASYICPHFSRMHLAAGDYLIVRSPDGARSWRYEKTGKEGLGEGPEGFWGIHVPGDTAVLELHGRAGGQHGYEIDRFARGLRPEEMTAPGPESICNVDELRRATLNTVITACDNWNVCKDLAIDLVWTGTGDSGPMTTIRTAERGGSASTRILTGRRKLR